MLFGACNQLSTSAAEAHKMTVMTLEDHSSKGWSHHQCHVRRIRRKCPPTAFPFPPPAASPPPTPPSPPPPSPPSLCLSCGQPGSSCTCGVSPLFRLYYSPYWRRSFVVLAEVTS